MRENTIEARYPSHWTTREKLGRFAWCWVERTLFRLSFRKMDAWRVFLLRRFGATIGDRCIIRPTVRIEVPWHLTMGNNTALGDRVTVYSLGHITLGDRVAISQNAHLCAGTHDYERMDFPLIKAGITVGDDAWVAADAFVGPGVEVGEGVVLGARAVAVKDLPAWTVCVGHPAVAVRPRKLEGASPHSVAQAADDTQAPSPTVEA